MNLSRMFTPVALAMAMALGTAGAASAQHRERDRSQDNRRDGARTETAQPQRRSEPQAAQRQQAAPRTFTQAPRQVQPEVRRDDRSRSFDNRGSDNRRFDNRTLDNRRFDNRSFDNRRFDNRGFDNRGLNNRGFDNRGFNNRGFDNRGFDNRRFSAPIVRGRYYSPRIIVPRIYRPGFTLGFGLFFGRPLPYRYSYPAYGYGYGRPAVAYGAISFQLNPGNAAIYVDGNYVGQAIDFCDSTRPLSLTAGTHRIELDADGFEPVAFDVNVVPGQLLPYQGSLQPAY
jgi:hypothetical protein